MNKRCIQNVSFLPRNTPKCVWRPALLAPVRAANSAPRASSWINDDKEAGEGGGRKGAEGKREVREN